MHPELAQFDIASDTDDALELSFALVARGVLEASAGPQALELSPDEWRQRIATAISPPGLTPWCLPGGDAEARVPTGSPVLATRLAQAWRDASALAFVSTVRLALLGSKDSVAGGFPKVAGWLGRELGHPGPSGTRAAGARIASIVQSTETVSRATATGWPLRIGVYPDDAAHQTLARLRAARHVRRGLANVFLLVADNPECDVLVAPYNLSDIRSGLHVYGFVPRAKVVLTRAPGLLNRAQYDMTMGFLQHDVGAALIATGLPAPDFESEWINQFIISLSHRNTLDVAIWDADAWHADMRGIDYRAAWRLPLIIADPDFLAASRLDNHLLGLARQIEQLNRPLFLSESTAHRLSIDPGVYIPTHLAERLREKVDYYTHEGDAATADIEISQIVAEALAQKALEVHIAAADGYSLGFPPVSPPLFTDLTFYEAGPNGRRIDEKQEALRVDTNYTLELMLRAVPQGISHRGSAPRAALATLPSADGIELLVIVSTTDADFEIPDPVQQLLLPEEAAAEVGPVCFRVKPKRPTLAPADLVSLEVRIYYQLNLLDFLELKAEVALGDPKPKLGLPVPIFVEQRSGAKRLRADLLPGLQPQQMSIDICRVNDSIRFTFVLQPPEAAGKQPIVLKGRQEISLYALRQELNRIRNVWEHIAVDVFAGAMQVGRFASNRALEDLAEAGEDLWTLLFKTGSQGGAMWAIGRWLKTHRLAEGSSIDVRLMDGAASFSFPWAMLYDAEDQGGKPDSTGFWGTRYSISQTAEDWPRMVTTPLGTVLGPSRMEFMLWNSFPNRGDQVAMLDTLMRDSHGGFKVDTQAPVDNESRFKNLVADCDADILYFYAHGHTRPAEADAGYNPVQRIKQAFSALPPEEQAGLKPLVDLISDAAYRVDESWIKLSGGTLFLRKLLRLENVNLRRHPVVILNMCQSAQMMPGLQFSFVQFFLQRRARAVIGTECPMTPIFAHPFSERLLREFLSGHPIGEALRRARASFMREGNPLGLAYTLHGTAGAHFGAPVVRSRRPLSAPPGRRRHC
ncbi:hypothetical protein WK60_00320 [Burkholderia ubonensis]|uniref:CHAT domain-containing protein n=1 Tax=Burkholderia ubonensis TaxID=101571 RepID=UPI000752F9F0|nr:CHAT domain-containing protein [Burkholderia ubonensis]KVT98534.1 hypothetical protein WK60_00320 [Burkholderia ubonensis]